MLSYSEEGDLLAMGNGSWANGGGHSVTKNGFFTAFYAKRGLKGCVGFELVDAATMLRPYLEGKVSKGTVCNGELSASYFPNTDTLILVSARESASDSEYVAEGLVAHRNGQGRAIGFTLESADQLLSPYLKETPVLSREC